MNPIPGSTKRIILIRPRGDNKGPARASVERPPALPVIPSTPPPDAVETTPSPPAEPTTSAHTATPEPATIPTPMEARHVLPKPVLPKPLPRITVAAPAVPLPVAAPKTTLPGIDTRGQTQEGDAGQTGEWADDTPQDNSVYRALLRGLYDAILIVRDQGRIVDCNRRALRFLQYSYAELCNDIRLPDLISGLTISILNRMRENIASGRFTLLDAVCVRRDQTRFPVEIAISRLTTDDRDDLVFSIRNVTRRRAIENQLRTEHQALENAGSGIVITDPQAVLTYANPAFFALFGIAENEGIGESIRSFWNCQPAPDDFVNTPLQGNRWSGEIEGRHRTGRHFRVQGTADANRDAQGTLLGIVYSFTDITERYQAEQRIRREAEAQIGAATQQDAFSGRLNIVSVTDIVQLIQTSGKTGQLSILDAENDPLGKAYFQEGELFAAEYGGEQGEAAFRILVQTEGGAFQFDPESCTTKDPSIQKSIMTLLMESAQQQDEAPEN